MLYKALTEQKHTGHWGVKFQSVSNIAEPQRGSQ